MLGVAISPGWLIMYPDIYAAIQTNVLELGCVSFRDKKKPGKVLIYIPVGKLLSLGTEGRAVGLNWHQG